MGRPPTARHAQTGDSPHAGTAPYCESLRSAAVQLARTHGALSCRPCSSRAVASGSPSRASDHAACARTAPVRIGHRGAHGRNGRRRADPGQRAHHPDPQIRARGRHGRDEASRRPRPSRCGPAHRRAARATPPSAAPGTPAGAGAAAHGSPSTSTSRCSGSRPCSRAAISVRADSCVAIRPSARAADSRTRGSRSRSSRSRSRAPSARRRSPIAAAARARLLENHERDARRSVAGTPAARRW